MRGADGKRLPLWLNTRTLTSHFFFGPYVLFPIAAALTWLGGILALLGLWVVAGKPRYRRNEASVVFISNVGATHQALFIAICCTVAAFYIASMFAERWLRHVDRLPTNIRRRELIFDWLAIFWCVVGSVGLILLSCFNAFTHGTGHWTMTVVFIVGVAISAIFQSAEIWCLHQEHPDRKSLRRNSVIKLIIVLLAIVLAICFGATYGVCHGDSFATNGHSADTCNRITSAAAAFEWAVAFVLTFYFLTIAADLWPAGKSSPRYMRSLAQWQERHGEGHDFTGRRAFGIYPERWQDKEAIMRENMLARNRGLATQVNNGPYTSYDPANGYVAPIGDGLTPLPPAHVHNGSIDYSAMGEGTEARTSMAGSDAPMMRQSAV
ncbi:hypothetical protein I307_03621 [Cryptococcus deuterogattii 99/473]|uniref:CWH43-like N-terminal domain-containing protein n=2 Tax=Cryptococcus deuterogattii TaxID=1859096 RepID=A0A0D0U512_9TREE|nr:hypothetical protein CNBG_3585 [Cryptococcus deuterogattii R265]KIR30511.1 hypothetical protein I309_00648 [Cryptococcus deuterogattii LA55]KIR36827.1 hypothetical protein I352_00139 [Cryptococcus deuterogattii MMRL2647]KIR43298.1 hypothetical protein I313_00140 [Cryptococcus deuterogattii Ram5]KIR74631.1 hypothetical protein I310_00905 [Cryptococcus deuterogattii CA1014]KIR92442.1 hypothetical protein I304_03846 [Cryptococcus deuterogattii CBS 10090]KIS01608.1 hypothetical protein L804_01